MLIRGASVHTAGAERLIPACNGRERGVINTSGAFPRCAEHLIRMGWRPDLFSESPVVPVRSNAGAAQSGVAGSGRAAAVRLSAHEFEKPLQRSMMALCARHERYRSNSVGHVRKSWNLRRILRFALMVCALVVGNNDADIFKCRWLSVSATS